MNFRTGLAVLVFLFASCLVTESEGIKCYVCSNCNDPFDSGEAPTQDCTGSCVKGKYSSTVVRLCSPIKEDDSCVKASSNGISGEACVCNSNYCNSSSVPKFSISVAVMMFVLRYMLKYAM